MSQEEYQKIFESNFENNSQSEEEYDPELVNVVRAKPVGLSELLQLRQVAKCDIFTGSGEKSPWGSLFGGQVLGQAVVAAGRTVPEEQRIHSLHGYFLRTGKSGIELLFEVERVRDGRSFATRVVKVLQENKVIFQVTMSFHVDEMGLEWQEPGREVEAIARKRGIDRLPLPEELLEQGVQALYHPADAYQLTEALAVAEGRWWNLRWVRHRSPLADGISDDAHAALLAWLSDYFSVPYTFGGEEERRDFFRGRARPRGDQEMFPLHISIDHSIHFHRPCSVDEWLLFHTRTTVSAGARALSRTEVYDFSGQLVATVNQEALIRPSVSKAKL